MNASSMALVASLFVGCLHKTPEATEESPPEFVALRTLTLTAGPAWDPTLPPEKQDLAGHFATMAARFDGGALLAYGPQADTGLGFYVYVDSVADPDERLVQSDPGIEAGVLAVHETGSWTLTIDALDAPSDAVFLVEYGPGPSWMAGRTLLEQDLVDHLAYIAERVGTGDVLAGGPVHDTLGRYVITAGSDAGAQALVDADPAVSSGIFAPVVHPWSVLARQSVATAQARAGEG